MHIHLLIYYKYLIYFCIYADKKINFVGIYRDESKQRKLEFLNGGIQFRGK